MHSIQKEIIKKMTPEKKLRISLQLYQSARTLKREGLRMQYPDLDEKALEQKLRDLFLHART
jgi:hypothetical protein